LKAVLICCDKPVYKFLNPVYSVFRVFLWGLKMKSQQKDLLFPTITLSSFYKQPVFPQVWMNLNKTLIFNQKKSNVFVGSISSFLYNIKNKYLLKKEYTNSHC